MVGSSASRVNIGLACLRASGAPAILLLAACISLFVEAANGSSFCQQYLQATALSCPNVPTVDTVQLASYTVGAGGWGRRGEMRASPSGQREGETGGGDSSGEDRCAG